MKYVVYILECADGTLYTGSTSNIVKRIKEHNTSKRGAKYTRARRPVVLKYKEECSSLSKALMREAALKKLPRAQKLEVINGR